MPVLHLANSLRKIIHKFKDAVRGWRWGVPEDRSRLLFLKHSEFCILIPTFISIETTTKGGEACT